MKSRKMVLIATIPGDLHAFAVAEALRIKGVEPILWFTSDYPMEVNETVEFLERGKHSRFYGLPAAEMIYFSIWNRRAIHELDTDKLHPADRSFASLQCRRFRTALLAEVLSNRRAQSGLCVNPYSRIVLAENKLAQSFAAERVGLQMPNSLFSNDPQEIRRFISDHGGSVAYKPLRAMAWVNEDEELMNFTRKLSEENLVEDELMELTPGIFQEIVPKEFELRITVLGNKDFPAKVNSQETTEGALDWRRAYDELTMDQFALPEDIRAACLKLMGDLGIYSGCFDFVVRPDGEWIFLEVNQGGQFLFVEEYTDFPLVDAFAEFLLQGTVDFKWEKTVETVKLKDVMSAAVEQAKASMKQHVISRPPSIVEKPPAREKNADDISPPPPAMI